MIGDYVMKICLLPLDSRPCNYRFPQQLANLRGVNLIEPPIDIMDFFKTPSNSRAIADWLKINCSDADVLVVSIDQLVYGGLIASRTNTKSLSEAQSQLMLLKDIKKTNPQLRIFAFNVLMRISISAVDKQSQIWWQKITEYSQLKYRSIIGEQEEKERANAQLAHLTKEIPSSILNEFLEVRRRNHTINMECISLVSQGILEQLVILQEDCSEDAIQVFEQDIIKKTINEYGLQNRVFIHNGTDEAGMELTVQAIAPQRQTTCDIQWLSENRYFTARYEDRPFIENLASHMSMMNIIYDPHAKNCLFILPPADQQGDYCPEKLPMVDYTPTQRTLMINKILEQIEKGKCCYLLDLVYANGGDLAFLEALAAKTPLTRLYGYAAWNTASNSLGTILAQMIAADSQNTPANKRFTTERLLDDLIYQAFIRQELQEELQLAGQDIWNITDLPRANKMLNYQFDKNRQFIRRFLPIETRDFKKRLPWPRTFEADIEVYKNDDI